MDIEYLLILQNIREATNGVFNNFFIFITTIAVDYYVLVPALIIFWTVNKKKGANILLTWGTALGIGAFLKTAFCVYRPWIKDARIQPAQEVLSGATGYSFPSGHSFSSGGFWNGLAINYRENKPLVAFSVLMVALVMFSRNFLGVHTPQDVIAGGLVSFICAVGVFWLCKWVDEKPQRDIIVLAAATVLMIPLLYYISNKSYPMDYVDGVILVDPKKMTIDGFKDPGRFYGIILGWFIERRFIRFDVEASTNQKIIRSLVGGLLVVFWWTSVAAPIGKYFNTGIMHFVTQATTPLVFMTVYPLLFCKLGRKQQSNSLEKDDCQNA